MIVKSTLLSFTVRPITAVSRPNCGIPQRITDDDHRLTIFVRAKSATQCRPDAQHIEKIRRDGQAQHEFRRRVGIRVKTDGNILVSHQAGETLGVIAKIHVIQVRDPAVSVPLARC